MSESSVWLIAAGALPAAGYLCGSVSFGYLAGRLRGIDIRQHGSCNVGATNAARVLGKRWGLAVFALDVFKGLAPVLAAGLFLRHGQSAIAGAGLFGVWLLTAFAAIVGHVWPVWLRFRGGKGVATSLGVVLGIWPFFTWPGLIALGVWIVVVLVSRYVSLASIAAAVAFPAALLAMSLAVGGEWALGHVWPLLIFGLAMPLLVILRHRTNISRLLSGTEPRIGRSRAQD